MTSWTPIEEALHAFALAALTPLGITDQRITLSEQDGPAPAAAGSPAVTFALGNDTLKGVDTPTTAVDAGDESVTITAIATREKVVTWRAYAQAANGDLTGRAILELLQLKTEFEDLRDALNEAGIGLLSSGNVQALPRVVNAKWESQAILEWRICVLQTAAQTIPYIAHVNGAGTVANADGSPPPLTVPIDVDLP